MDLTPFTKEEAIDICDDFEDLIGTKFSNEESILMKIDNVVIGPYYDEDITAFASNYLLTKDKDAALSFYNNDEYDVFVIAYPVDDKEQYFYTNIRSFAGVNGVNYQFPVKS